jgi:hypothetical protein
VKRRFTGPVRTSRWVFAISGAYGLAVLLPTYLMVDAIGEASVPISHLEYFYGFTGAGVAWQLAFLLIATDVERYRIAMLPAILEKLAFGIPALLVASRGQLPAMTLPFAVIDLCLAVLFAACFFMTRPRSNENEVASP